MPDLHTWTDWARHRGAEVQCDMPLESLRVKPLLDNALMRSQQAAQVVGTIGLPQSFREANRKRDYGRN